MEAKNTSFKPPVVTIMGHVDHGKTTLLDAIRKTNLAAREQGGITQHIGAYQILFQEQPITFIDTPGHEAFEKMRSRGAEVADIVILVVAANDGVKPQTSEAVKHIKKAQKPIIVALTKIDLPDINIEKVKSELQKEGVVVEGYGGDVPVVELSALKGEGINELLEVIQLVWQLSPQISLPSGPLEAVVVESFLDKSRGPIVTVIVKKGTLKVGQKITVDDDIIAIKALIDDSGKNIEEVFPGKPVEVLGFKKILEVGSIVTELTRTKKNQSKKPLEIADLIAKSEQAKEKFKVIIKADVYGTLEAILANLPEKILVLYFGVGEVTKNDLSFAKVANAPILAFNLKIDHTTKQQAQRDDVIIKEYHLIYQLLSDLENISTSFEQVKHELKIAGRAKIVASFNIEGQKIAGASVTHGKIKIGDRILLSHESQKQEATISSLKRFKKNVEMVGQGQECGIVLNPSLDFKEGDIIESLG